MRAVLYCASMIAATSCVSANARPYIAPSYLSAPSTIVCNDHGCAPAAAASRSVRVGTTRRLLIRRHGSLRTYSRRYARRRVREEPPRHVRVVSRSWSRSWSRHTVALPRRRARGVITIQTAANPITVASAIAGQMRALISDLVAHGYRGHVTCLASGHMPHSLHHTGEACDFAQLRRNVVAPGAGIMYRARSIIVAHGLRDGCSFHDCGHVDSGRMNFRARAQWIPVAHIRHYARRYYGGRYYGHRFYQTAGRRH